MGFWMAPRRAYSTTRWRERPTTAAFSSAPTRTVPPSRTSTPGGASSRGRRSTGSVSFATEAIRSSESWSRSLRLDEDRGREAISPVLELGVAAQHARPAPRHVEPLVACGTHECPGVEEVVRVAQLRVRQAGGARRSGAHGNAARGAERRRLRRGARQRRRVAPGEPFDERDPPGPVGNGPGGVALAHEESGDVLPVVGAGRPGIALQPAILRVPLDAQLLQLGQNWGGVGLGKALAGGVDQYAGLAA